MGQNEADVDINTENSESSSGSNDTMQNYLSSIVQFFTFRESHKLCFSSDLGNDGQRTTVCFKWLLLHLDRVFQPILIKFGLGANIKKKK